VHPDLEKWLNDVWPKRADIFKGFQQNGRAIHAEPILTHKGINRVYDMYTAGETGANEGATSGSANTPEFLRDVADLVETTRAKCVVQDEEFWTVSVDGLRTIAEGSSLVWDWEPENEDDPGRFVLTPETIVSDFIHVRHQTNFEKQKDQRVYLNLAAKGRGTVFAEIVEGVYDHAGFRSSKVSCPGSAPRNDTALLYLADEAAVQSALEFLRKYQQRHPGAFLPGLPRLTAAVPGLTGIGRGMEPPKYVVIRQDGAYYKKQSAMSFGLWRSALIFMALDRTYWTRPGESDSQRLAAFKRRAVKYFLAAGIDPDNPSVQKNPDTLPKYAG
jgi:hypothetical protein